MDKQDKLENNKWYILSVDVVSNLIVAVINGFFMTFILIYMMGFIMSYSYNNNLEIVSKAFCSGYNIEK